jgi:hypothetical protein
MVKLLPPSTEKRKRECAFGWMFGLLGGLLLGLGLGIIILPFEGRANLQLLGAIVMMCGIIFSIAGLYLADLSIRT